MSPFSLILFYWNSYIPFCINCRYDRNGSFSHFIIFSKCTRNFQSWPEKKFCFKMGRKTIPRHLVNVLKHWHTGYFETTTYKHRNEMKMSLADHLVDRSTDRPAWQFKESQSWDKNHRFRKIKVREMFKGQMVVFCTFLKI